MKQILKLYKYYLKKLLKSWYFWVFLILLLIWIFGLPLLVYNFTGDYNINTHKFTKWKEMFPNYRDFLREISGTRGKQNHAPYYFPHVAKDFFLLNSESAWKDILSVLWKFFMWGTIGICASFLLLFSGASALINSPEKNGEDKTALNVASPIKRDYLVISKILAFFTYFVLAVFLTFVIPYLIYYFLIATKISWAVVLTFFFLTSLIFPLLYFLLFGTILIYLNSLSAWLSGIFAFILALSPLIWHIIKERTRNPLGGNPKWVENLAKASSNLLVIIPLALLIGGLFLFLYRERFRQKDFS
ncbi:MAG: hypothetical protein MRECE_10c048 [Mycoplasmataceae bacterium CE_OT135]|nr:MAG: hypothetical protein MRECE_10c048 [Mycoplasmataceae bacterium CE_OT135]